MVLNGTAVTQGTGRMVVTSTGMGTQMGRIVGMLDKTQEEPTPLQKEMARVSKILGLAALAVMDIPPGPDRFPPHGRLPGRGSRI